MRRKRMPVLLQRRIDGVERSLTASPLGAVALGSGLALMTLIGGLGGFLIVFVALVGLFR